jgi:hypothetical protein
MHGLVDQVVDNAISDDLVANVSSGMIDVVGSLASQSGDFDCSNYTAGAPDLFNTTCVWTGQTYECNGGSEVDYICSLINDDSMNASQKLALLSASGYDGNLLRAQVRSALQEAMDESVDNLYPSAKYMVVVPLAIGTAVAFLTAVYLAVTYIASVTKTILQLRCGAIETLRDKSFFRYRVATDQVAILTGSLFWGCLVASLVVGGFVSTVIFFFLWYAMVSKLCR